MLHSIKPCQWFAEGRRWRSRYWSDWKRSRMNRKAEATSCMEELGVEKKNKQVPKFLGQERE